MNFYEKVYRVVLAIPAGKVVNYGQVARMLDNPRASRAVGYAMRALNTAPEEYENVPWFRVINSSGAIRPNHGLQAQERQAKLLRAEGIQVIEKPEGLFVDLKEYRWDGLTLPEIKALLKS